MAKPTDRFVVVYKEGGTLSDMDYKQLLVDKQTGVTYLFMKSGYGAAITPLLNADGTPVITNLPH